MQFSPQNEYWHPYLISNLGEEINNPIITFDIYHLNFFLILFQIKIMWKLFILHYLNLRIFHPIMILTTKMNIIINLFHLLLFKIC